MRQLCRPHGLTPPPAVQCAASLTNILSRLLCCFDSELDPDNRVVSVLAPASTSGLRVGDWILEVDGHALGSDMLVSVLEKNSLRGPDHELRIRREKEPMAA